MRRQLPVYSPLTLGMLMKSATGIVSRIDHRLVSLLKDAFQAEHVSLLGSGTYALQAALREARRTHGERSPVALPAFSCYDMATAAVAVGNPVLLYDVNPHTLQPDFDMLRTLVRNGVRTVVAGPLYGVPVQWNDLEAAIGDEGVLVIEDAAQGHGASYQGRPAGTLGRMSILSFGRGKGWTGGQGGALLARGGSVIQNTARAGGGVAGELRSVAGLAGQWALGRPALYGLPQRLPSLRLGETVYHAPTDETRMSAMSVAMVIASTAASDREAAVRRTRGAYYRESLGEVASLRLIDVVPGATPGYLRFPVLHHGGLASLKNSDGARALGIAPSYPIALSDLPPMRALLATEPLTPGAQELARNLITLPTHSLLSEDDLESILRIFR
jgi:dTDP-4-amino-4,6-dideoxygalactose transaminase